MNGNKITFRSKSCLLFLLAGLFGAFPTTTVWAAPNLNWIVNGDFTSASGWNAAVPTQPGRGGQTAAYLENPSPAWTEYTQKIQLPQPLPLAVEISGWVKCENVVKGPNDWEVARITVVFYDVSGTRVGDWPPSICEIQGTHDWASYSNQYPVPQGTAYATVGFSLGNCTGKAWFSDLRMIVYDYDQKPLAVGQAAHPDKKPPMAAQSDNWLLDPDFETPGSRDWQGGTISADGHNSLHCLVVANATPAWTLPSQDVSFKGQSPAFVVYGGWIKTDSVVQGTENYMAARLGMDFRDANGKQVGGWQDEGGKVVGTTDWTYYEKKYAVPPGAAMAHVDAGLGDCAGTASFDDLSLKLLDADGNPITTIIQEEQVTDTSDWYAYQPPDKYEDTPLDLSFMNDKPAGSHGFVKAMNGHFEFADGTRIRFWGTDLVGPHNFPTHDQADALAQRLSKLGVNIIRFQPDASWSLKDNFFDPDADNTLTLQPSQVEKFDYLVSALKKNGIYLYPDFMVDRKFRSGDGVAAWQELELGPKGVIHFDKRIIELNKKYAEELLGHVNPYTGMALKDDPAYVGNEIINESSIFCGFGEQKFPEVYWDELQKLYSAWGGHGKITRFKFDFETQKLVPVQNPENAGESLKFLLLEVIKTDQDMKSFLARLSPHALLTGSNMGLPVLGNILSDFTMDFMDTHAYWDHPQIWNIEGGWNNVSIAPMNNHSQLLSPFQGSLLFNLSHDAVQGKPLIVTEWNDCFPNEYRIEGPMLMAAYGSLQDWDGLMQFDHGLDLPGTTRMTNFDINCRVDDQPLYQAGALIFRLGYLKAASVTVVEPLSDKAVLSNGMKSDWLFDHPWLPYVAKVEKRFTGDKEEPLTDISAIENRHSETEKEVDSSTGEETLYYGQGFLKIDSPCAQGLVGNIGNGETLGTTGIWVEAAKRNPWAAVFAVSLDQKPLDQSAKIILIADALAENSGQTYNSTRTALKNPGQPPILMQGVKGVVSIVVNPAMKYTVVPLDESGREGKPIKTAMEHGGLKFSISPTDHTSYYLVSGISKTEN
jgi:hypothetical protein